MLARLPRLPFALDPLIAEAKRRARQRRLLVCLGLGLLAALAAGLALALRQPGGGPSGGLAIPAASVRAGALTAPVPRGFRQLEIRHGKAIGWLVTDYRVTRDSHTLTESIFPANGVLLSIGRAPSGSLPKLSVPTLRLPLTLSGLGGPKGHPNGTTWNNSFHFRGQLYAITFWAGNNAPPADRAALQHALLSIHASQ
jgi:hypothetical protein